MARTPSAIATRRIQVGQWERERNSGTRDPPHPLSTSSPYIQSELREWMTAPPDGCSLLPTPSGEPSLTEWTLAMAGPPSSIYEGESFRLRVRFDPDYPLEPPEVVFLPPVPAHEHIYSNGHCCLDTLYTGRNGGYSPALTISKLALALQSMLASATAKRRPEGDADYCRRTAGRSPKQTVFVYDDDRV